MAEPKLEILQQRWTHSHEEDQVGRLVFRPQSWSFPPSRGRKSFELLPGGRLLTIGPSPTDRMQEAAGTWRLLPRRRLELRPAGQRGQVMTIIEADQDRLVVKLEDPTD